MNLNERELERIAAHIADDESIDWRLLARLDTREAATGNGLRELSSLAQVFRSMNLQMPVRERGAVRFRFAGLDVIEKIGEGAHGEVWRAYDPLLDQQVALKLRKLDSGVLAHQFLEEGRQLARIRHANVVSVYGAAIDQGRAGLWMELVRGESLKNVLREHGPLPVEEVIAIGIELCSALAAVHAHGLVHGDLKAENVLCDASGRTVLTDFGAARDIVSPARGVISGTLAYLAPELLDGEPVTPASDIYALGVLLFHLLSGRFPIETTDPVEFSHCLRANRHLRLKKLVPGLPRRIARLIERAMAPSPGGRPHCAREFARLLSLATAPASSRRLLPWMAAGLGAIALLVAIAALRQPLAPPSLAVEASLQRLLPRGTETLVDGSQIAVGDRLVLRVASERDLWIYVFDDDGSGRAAQLFPLREGGPTNPVTAAAERQLPGVGLSWQIDRKAVQDEFLVLASEQSLPEVEQLVADWEKAQWLGPSRGALTVTSAPITGELQSAALREVVARLADHSNVRRWHWRLPQQQ